MCGLCGEMHGVEVHACLTGCPCVVTLHVAYMQPQACFRGYDVESLRKVVYIRGHVGSVGDGDVGKHGAASYMEREVVERCVV